MLRKAGADVVIVDNGLAAMETIYEGESTLDPLGAAPDQRFRRHIDGHADAGDGRLRCDAYSSGARIWRRYHCTHGTCDGKRPDKVFGSRLHRLLTKPVDRQGLLSLVASHCVKPLPGGLEPPTRGLAGSFFGTSERTESIVK